MEKLQQLPARMRKWGLRLEFPYPNQFGEFVLVGIDPADIELHHQVVVLDESFLPLVGIMIMFGYDTGLDHSNKLAPVSYWTNSPNDLRGNAQFTNTRGYAQHTLGQGGETIFVYDVISDDGNRVLKLSSPIVRHCVWVQDQFSHTGVKLTFQRRKKGVRIQTLAERFALIEEVADKLRHEIDEIERVSYALTKRIDRLERKGFARNASIIVQSDDDVTDKYVEKRQAVSPIEETAK